ncbi:MAG: hypothetical protein IKN74_04855 [Clostridia bacterium]|nr:hypothetical protein [Clostridia bacterium]
MGNNEVDQERDRYIKKVLQEDKIMSKPVVEKTDSYLNNNKVKMRRYSKRQKNWFKVVLVLLIISLAVNVYQFTGGDLSEIGEFISSHFKKNPTPEIVEDVDFVDNTVPENKTPGGVVTTLPFDNKVENKTSSSVKFEDINSVDKAQELNVDTNSLSTLLNSYVYVLGRINDDEKEITTAYVIVANDYLTRLQKAQNSLQVNSALARTYNNFNNALTEMYSEYDFNIKDCYPEYLSFTEATNAYFSREEFNGKINQEKYSITNLKVTNKLGSEYRAVATVTRDYNGIISTFDVVFNFVENTNYTYSKYKITSFRYELEEGNVDNTTRLINFNGFTVSQIDELLQELNQNIIKDKSKVKVGITSDYKYKVNKIDRYEDGTIVVSYTRFLPQANQSYSSVDGKMNIGFKNAVNKISVLSFEEASETTEEVNP